MLCPFCKIDIDNDSSYCDQCGQEILVCPKCNKPGKGKVCTSDGTPLVAIKTKIGASTVSVVSAVSGASAVSMTSPGGLPTPASVAVDGGELHLINKNLGIDLKIQSDTIIGRTTGNFSDIFARHQQVSGKHCQISLDYQKGWMVSDLNSTNGTKYNNIPLKPFQPQSLSDRGFLLIANIEFYIEIRSQANKTVRI